MIYIKNYRSISLKKLFNEPDELTIIFSKLIGKPIIVFADSGGTSGRGFTGLLLSVGNNSIELLLKSSSSANIKNNCRCSSCRKKQRNNFMGTKVKIFLNHITAITYNYI